MLVTKNTKESLLSKSTSIKKSHAHDALDMLLEPPPPPDLPLLDPPPESPLLPLPERNDDDPLDETLELP